jgi:hypothetical protein
MTEIWQVGSIGGIENEQNELLNRGSEKRVVLCAQWTVFISLVNRL